MCATAANFIEDVQPEVALRQWALTFPFAWRRRLAQGGALFGALTRIFVDSVERFYSEHAVRRGARGAVKTGSVTVVQRTSSDLRMNPRPTTPLLPTCTAGSLRGARSRESP
ncbi:hypothetical protein WMF28_01745 [Sorangium sp. So ce590]|uniref:hypothetical protein n=1 Tax=Sorangium sp. So ce590 TaxID=3133317 RepID=UPI003F647569